MILVTGSTGMLGTHLLKKLCCSKGNRIKALYNTESKKEYSISMLKLLVPDAYKPHIEDIIWVKANLLDIPSLEVAFDNVTHVYHCAAWVGNSPRDYTLMRKVNIKGTANMVNLSIENAIEKFCHVSSIATLGRYPDDRIIDEEAHRDTDNDRSVYSITKYGAEMEVWRASQEGLKTIIVNPGVILGSGFFESGSGLLFSKVLNNFKYYPPKHTGFVFVDDVIKAMIIGMQSQILNQRYILVGENLSFKTVMTYIANTFQKKKPTIKVNKILLYITWSIQNIVNIFKPLKTKLTRDTIMLINSKFKYDNSKSIRDFKLEYTPIQDSVLKIYNDYKLLNPNLK